ncbi:hypothetical protein MAPG_02358 [Magnaporthiopsis poae ATCC 64411]|uniref:Uncharacterized protein n=1 Tax=Magnaporthiopsis poae (strain ATCC 64411 / 73-15) TaxID=644358 RepID=A0A0C4DR55_MAGP6|nr:hypothetical protein MAPG_02358 [Magnaporthiopsis poae ATCC 64411]
MFGHRIATTAAVFALLAAALGGGITDDVRSGFRMGGSLLPRQTKDLQAFNGALGGAKAQSITQSSDQKRPFEVNGDTFTDFRSAADRACDNQKNACANMANGSKKGEFSVGDCDKQNEECKSAAASATQTAFNALVSSNAEFDFFCDL